MGDLCSALTAGLLNPKVFGQKINLGRGKPISGEQIIKIIEKVSRQKIITQIEKKRLRKIDKSILYANINKAKKVLGWRPQKSLEQSIEEILKHKNLL